MSKRKSIATAPHDFGGMPHSVGLCIESASKFGEGRPRHLLPCQPPQIQGLSGPMQSGA